MNTSILNKSDHISKYNPQIIFSSGFFETLLKEIPNTLDLLEKAIYIQQFLVCYFNIEVDYLILQNSLTSEKWAGLFRKQIMQKTIARTYTFEDVKNLSEKTFAPYLTCSDESIAKQALHHLDDSLALYCAWRLYHPDAPVSGIFKIPKQIKDLDYLHATTASERQGFGLYTHLPSSSELMAEAAYCLKCHPRGKDTCRTGLSSDTQGCPVNLPISEMISLYEQGHVLAALILAMHAHPMILLTGHRICNDCMKSCIFQTQEPVNVPALETRLMDACLALPWGFEIIYLLSYWDPLRPKVPETPKKGSILVVGLGPAGITLAHQLLIKGHSVAAMEGMTLADMPSAFLHHPIKSFQDLQEPLDTRRPQGFGGVMEYGITSRWNKNYLLAARLILERHSRFKSISATRFGDSFSYDHAFSWGFDHVSLALGAGKPHIPNLPNMLRKGVFLASDFLMRLHQGMAHHKASPNKIPLTSPVVVIGGGLTAIDTATEALAYLKHTHHPDPKVTLMYRRAIHSSPSYQQNPLEVQEAVAQGVQILDEADPISLTIDIEGSVKAIQYKKDDIPTTLEARTVFIATGTEKNRMDLFTAPLHTYKNQISLIGDLNPKYAGSVVKAIASALHSAPLIHTEIQKKNIIKSVDLHAFQSHFKATVHQILAVAPNIIELQVHAPHHAQTFKPGQYFRVLPVNVKHEVFKPLALSGVKAQKDILTLLVVGHHPVNAWCHQLEKGDFLSLMGPNGAPSFIPHHQKVVLVGSSLGHGILKPIISAMKQQGCHVHYIAFEPENAPVYYEDELRKDAHAFYTTSSLETVKNLITQHALWDHGLIIGPRYVAESLQSVCATHPIEVGVMAPLFCMMQGLCGTCLQRHVDSTGTESWVFTCETQEQPLKSLDFSL